MIWFVSIVVCRTSPLPWESVTDVITRFSCFSSEQSAPLTNETAKGTNVSGYFFRSSRSGNGRARQLQGKYGTLISGVTSL